ncbi:MAG: hypothetical protein RIE58_04960 [Vicingaceae bacterium]
MENIFIKSGWETRLNLSGLLKDNHIASIALIFLFFGSCEKSEEFFLDDQCHYDFQNCVTVETTYSPFHYDRVKICDSRSIIYTLRDQANGIYRLMVYDRQNNERRIIQSDIQVVSELDVKGDLVIYSDLDWQLRTVNINTGHQELLTNSPRNLGGRFNEFGDRIYYARSYNFSQAELNEKPERRYQYKMMVSDLNGSVIDSICVDDPEGYCQNWETNYDWFSDNEFIARGLSSDQSNWEVSLYEHDGRKIKSLFEVSLNAGVESIVALINSNKFYFGTKSGIFEYDTQTNSSRMIVKACRNSFYPSFDISEDGKYLIAVKSENIVMDKCSAHLVSYLVQISTVDGNESIILQ